jgi:hypothetical protein
MRLLPAKLSSLYNIWEFHSRRLIPTVVLLLSAIHWAAVSYAVSREDVSLMFVSAGSRQIATGLNIAKQTGAKIFVTSMCIGSGMGMAAVFVNEQ